MVANAVHLCEMLAGYISLFFFFVSCFNSFRNGEVEGVGHFAGDESFH